MLTRLLLSSLFLFNLFFINAGIIEYRHIVFSTLNDKYNQELIDISEKTIIFYEEYLNYLTKDVFNIFETESLEKMRLELNTPSFIGGFYLNGNSYIQPIFILKKKDVLAKTIFIEYGHFILDSYTNKNIPGWFNEGSTAYIYSIFSKTDFKFHKRLDFTDFTNFANIIKDKNKLQSFYFTFYIFIEKLNNKTKSDFIINILKSLKNGEDFEEAFYQVTKVRLKEFYEKNINAEL